MRPGSCACAGVASNDDADMRASAETMTVLPSRMAASIPITALPWTKFPQALWTTYRIFAPQKSQRHLSVGSQ